MNLHSSMVRLETNIQKVISLNKKQFTFQYGQIRNDINDFRQMNAIQIYIPVWLDQKQRLKDRIIMLFFYLHSSMVRLETDKYMKSSRKATLIYIPVWLDQKQLYCIHNRNKQ